MDYELKLSKHPLDRCCVCGYFRSEKNKYKFIFQQIKNSPYQNYGDTYAAVPIIETEYYVCKNGLRCEARQIIRSEKQDSLNRGKK